MAPARPDETMTVVTREEPIETPSPAPEEVEKSDWRVVLQFFLVPLALVAVLVTVFFGLQVLRARHPDPRTTLDDLRSKGGFLLPWVGDPKRWQSGYDLSLLLRAGGGSGAPLLQDLAAAFGEARRSGDVKLARYLALALGRTGDPRAGAALASGLEDADEEIRLFSAWGLTQIGDATALPGLRRAAGSDSDGGVRKMAVFALGQLGDRAGASVLREALADRDTDVRWNAAIALARLDDPSGEDVLIEILERSMTQSARPERTAPSDDLSPVLNAIRALALLHDERSRAALERAARSAGDEEVRATAGLALEAADGAARGTSP